VLVVAASPDGRRSTASLRRAVSRLGRERDLSVEWWFLRDVDSAGTTGSEIGPRTGPASTDAPIRVVDHLRTSPVSTAFTRWGADRVAARLAGLRLRAWWRRARPDVVVLDDGLGGRLLPERPPPVVVRVNPTGPAEPAASEDRWSGPVAGWWYSPGAPVDAPSPTVPPAVIVHERLEFEPPSASSPDAVGAARRAAGLPVDELVVLWSVADAAGADAADELAVMLEWLVAGDDRFDRPVHVVWVDPDLTAESHARVATAARRAGVAERVHQRAAVSSGLTRAADAVVRGLRTGDADGGHVPADGDAFEGVVRLVAEVARGVDR